MKRTEATRFVHDWLWESPRRLTTQLPWSTNYIEDAISMVMDAVNNIEDQGDYFYRKGSPDAN